MSDHYHNLSIANLNVPSADFYAQNGKYFSMPHFSSMFVKFLIDLKSRRIKMEIIPIA